MSELQRLTNEVARVAQQFNLDPLAACPLVLQAPVLRLWGMYSHLFPTPLPLAAQVGAFVGDRGLTPEDAAAAIETMRDPALAATFKFASDLATALAAECAKALIRRRAERERAAEHAAWMDWARRSDSERPEVRRRVGNVLADVFRERQIR